MDLPNDCLRCIANLLPPKDWLAFNMIDERTHALATDLDRLDHLYASKGPLYCAEIRSLNGLLLTLKEIPCPNFVHLALIAVLNNQSKIVEWICINRPEVRQSLGYITYTAALKANLETLFYLVPLCNLERRYTLAMTPRELASD